MKNILNKMLKLITIYPPRYSYMTILYGLQKYEDNQMELPIELNKLNKSKHQEALSALGYEIVHLGFLNWVLIDKYLGKAFYYRSYSGCWTEFVKQNKAVI